MNDTTENNATDPQRRAILLVTGADAASLLSGLITNGPPEALGEARFSSLLTPQGKILFDFIIVKTADGFAFDVDADAAPALLKRLKLYRLRAKVDLSIDETKNIGLGDAPNGAVAYPDPRHGSLPSRYIADRQQCSASWSAYDTARITAGVAEAGVDFPGEDIFPMDVNYDRLNGVDYKKGCFVGQEVASRMKRKSEARKRTILVSIDGAPPAPETAIVADGSTLGHVMSGVEGKALALIRLDRWAKAQEAGGAITADGIELRLALPAYLDEA